MPLIVQAENVQAENVQMQLLSFAFYLMPHYQLS